MVDEGAPTRPFCRHLWECYTALRRPALIRPCCFPASARTRRASFTALEVGKTLAMSRSSTTILVPLANRGKYLPRTPPEKSYSGLICSTLTFFIADSFAANRRPRINDTDSLLSICVRNDHQVPGGSDANEQKSTLVNQMIWVRDCNRQCVVKMLRSRLRTRPRAFSGWRWPWPHPIQNLLPSCQRSVWRRKIKSQSQCGSFMGIFII